LILGPLLAMAYCAPFAVDERRSPPLNYKPSTTWREDCGLGTPFWSEAQRGHFGKKAMISLDHMTSAKQRCRLAYAHEPHPLNTPNSRSNTQLQAMSRSRPASVPSAGRRQQTSAPSSLGGIESIASSGQRPNTAPELSRCGPRPQRLSKQTSHAAMEAHSNAQQEEVLPSRSRNPVAAVESRNCQQTVDHCLVRSRSSPARCHTEAPGPPINLNVSSASGKGSAVGHIARQARASQAVLPAGCCGHPRSALHGRAVGSWANNVKPWRPLHVEGTKVAAPPGKM